MAIFRGTGGQGDSTTDTTVTTVTEKAAEAASSATSAADSATSAANSASSASTSETNAATSETNAATSATNSATSATNSATSATSASTSATTATTKASEASASATNAATSATAAQTAQTAAEAAQTAAETAETNAETAEANTLAIFGDAQDVQDAVDDAEKLAINPEDSQYTLSDGTTTGYSALHHAAKAEDHKTAAEVSKNAAETAETAAETAQGLAETAKTAAETAQSAAETAQAAAELAQSNAETVYDDFDDRYLGTKSGDPLVDNDNEGLTTGTLYFNTTENEMRVYTGTAWVAVVDLGGDVTVNSLTSNNDVVVKGNLEVQGTTITVDSATAQTIDLGDNDKIRLGDSDDLQIYHDGNHSYISDIGTGNLIIQGAHFLIQTPNAEKILQGLNNGAVSLYYDGSKKLDTTSTGVDVTGNITVSGTVDGRDVAADGATLDAVASTYVDVSGDTLTGDLAFGDNDKAIFGASNDLQIYHTGTNSIINEVGAGNLVLSTNGTQVRIAHSTNGETMAEFNKNGSALLKYDGANKLETTSSGVNVTGTLVADGLTVDGFAQVRSVIPYYFLIETDSTDLNTGLRGADGQFQIRTFGDNLSTSTTRFALNHSSGDISFYEDTGTTAKLTWDASAEELQFKDNVKAEFGDGNDLQILHNGTNSQIINNTGTLKIVQNVDDGDVEINADNGSGGTANYFKADSSTGEAILYHYGSEKLKSQSTGIDVTGTVTADGLTVENNNDTTINFGNAVDANDGTTINVRKGAFTSSKIQFLRTNDQYNDFEIKVADDEDVLLTYGQGNISNDLRFRRSASLTPVLRLKNSGDISFYDDSGTSQDFYWDASTSRLGIRNTAPTYDVDIIGEVNSNANLRIGHINRTTTGRNETFLRMAINTRASDGVNRYSRYDFKMASVNDYSAAHLTLKYRQDGVNQPDVLNIRNSGDIEFFAQDGTTSDFYWDKSTSRLGLGTTSPTQHLEVSGSGTQWARVVSTDASGAGLKLRSGGSSDMNIQDDVGVLKFSRGSTEQMRLDSSGRLGIGTTAPSSYASAADDLVIKNASHTGITIHSGTTDTGLISFADGTTGDERYRGWVEYQHTSDTLTFGTAGSEAARIDSSGNLLVGTTSDLPGFGNTAEGISLRSGSHALISRSTTSGNSVLYLNKNTADGNILDFRKDGSTVGSIGTVFSDLCIGTGDTGIRFWDAGPGIFPVDPSNTFANKDNAIDLGLSSVRWKDLYLSDGLRADTLKFSSLAGSEYGRFDSNGRLGINKTNPTATLDVEGTIRARQGGSEFTDLKYYGVEFNRSLSYIRPDTDGTKDLYIGYNGVNKAWRDLLLDADRAIVFNANASEAARINSNGRLGIGTTSPSSRLHIDSETSTEILRIDHYYNGNQPALILNNQSGNALAGSRISFRASDTEECAIAWARGSGGSSYLAFHANESERMRLDSSGNLLVGGTNAFPSSNNVVGSALKSNGQGQFSRDSGTVLNLNRKTSDGTIVEFRKDGSTIGSIGTNNDQLYIGRDDTGIRFTSGDDALLPVNANSGALRSGNIDLGKSYGQFRNLYLSGGVYLGGTGSANLLDDYEEGTFTPSAASVTQGPTAGASASYSGRYTKIGRIVHCQVEVFLDSTDAVAIDDRFLVGNLPFAVNSSLLTGVGTGWMYSLFSGGNNAFLSTGVYPNENIAFYVTHIDGSVTYASTIKVEFTYETSA